MALRMNNFRPIVIMKYSKHRLAPWSLLLLFTFVFMLSCKKANQDKDAIVSEVVENTAASQQGAIPVYTFDEFEPMLHKAGETTYVVNFWATWCKPCIKELPYFEKVAVDYAGKNVEVLLVSLDFPRLLEKQVIPFVRDNNIKSPVVLLDDTGANEWIPKVDETWSGAIPATLIYKGKQRKFYEGSFTLADLEKEINSFL